MAKSQDALDTLPNTTNSHLNQKRAYTVIITKEAALLYRLFLGNLQISTNKELQKQKQITAIHDKGSSIVFSFNLTQWIRLEKVKARQGDGDATKHLRNLHHGNNLGIKPFRADSERHQTIITVHGGVDRVVHGDKKDTVRRGGDIGMPAVQQDGNVMVPVQENEFFLVNDNKKGIEKFAACAQERMTRKGKSRAGSKQRHLSLERLFQKTYGNLESTKNCTQRPVLPLP